MRDYYFKGINQHFIHIELEEAEVRRLWERHRDQIGNDTPLDFTMWCIFLLNNKVSFYYYKSTKPTSYIEVE